MPLVPHTTVGRSSSASWSRRRTRTSWSRARRRSSLSRRSVRLLQKAEEEQGQGESARPLPQHLAPTPVLQNRAAPLTTRTSSHGRHHPVGAVAAMVERLGEAHDEALGEIEEREKHFAAVFGDGDDEILSSPGL